MITPAAREQIIGYSTQDLQAALNTMETSLSKGGQAKVSLYTENLPTDEDLAQLFLDATAAGFHMEYPRARVESGVATTEIILTKGSPQWALLVPLIPTLFIVGLIAFGITHIEAIGRTLLPIFITAVVGLIAIAGLMRKPAERVAERAAERYLPKA